MTVEQREAMVAAKRRFTAAAKATLAGDPAAPELVRIALEHLDRARAALASNAATTAAPR